MREIGSEFWTQYEPVHTENTENQAYLLSGRTALRFIIDDICTTQKVQKVLMPSYCCESMIQPFVDSGIDIEFYQVSNDYTDYPFDNDADIVFLIDFFGYVNEQNSIIACREKQAGKIVIYDATHKLDGNPDVEIYADYSFCSYRKWFYCNFAKAVKNNGEFDKNIKLSQNYDYVYYRDKAAAEKRKYIQGITDNKESFLSLFSSAEEFLDEDYAGYRGTAVCFNADEIVSARRKNAEFLINELKKIPQITLWRDCLQKNDTPLFVPVLVDRDIREELRSRLIINRIYCPIHWPRSHYHGRCNDLYVRELSLICDQRYDIADMQRMIDVIKDYFNR